MPDDRSQARPTPPSRRTSAARSSSRANDGDQRHRALEERRHRRRHRAASKDIDPGADGSLPEQLTERRTARSSSRRRRRRRLRALEERRHRRRHRPGQGHQRRPGGSQPAALTDVDGTLFFVANDGATAPSCGGATAPRRARVLVKDIMPGAGELGPVAPRRTSAARSSSAPTTAATGDELWKSDGTAAGTALVKDIKPASRRLRPAASQL